MGRVDQVVRGKDSLIRELTVAYRNSTESFDKITNRAVRSLVKLFSVDEDCVQKDLKELQVVKYCSSWPGYCSPY